MCNDESFVKLCFCLNLSNKHSSSHLCTECYWKVSLWDLVSNSANVRDSNHQWCVNGRLDHNKKSWDFTENQLCVNRALNTCIKTWTGVKPYRNQTYCHTVRFLTLETWDCLRLKLLGFFFFNSLSTHSQHTGLLCPKYDKGVRGFKTLLICSQCFVSCFRFFQ